MSTTCPDPFRNFFENFLIDISDEFVPIIIGAKLERFVIPTYDANRPTNSLTSIAYDFRSCIEPQVGSAAVITATELATVIFFIIILTAIFMILVVIIIISLNKQTQKEIIIGLILFFALLYIIVGWLLIHNSFLIISNQITNIEQVTDNCVNKAINATETFFSGRETAIDKALCAYP